MKTNTAIVLLLLSVGLFYTFTNDQYKQVKAISVTSSEYKDALNNTSQIETLRDNLLTIYNNISPLDIERLNKALPDNIDTVRLALDLDSIASRHGLAIKSLQAVTRPVGNGEFAVMSDGNSYEKVVVTFNFVSNYTNFIGLITDLEQNLRVMNIKSVSFDTIDSGLYEHEVSIETYWLK
jgi:hypothetical protein